MNKNYDDIKNNAVSEDITKAVNPIDGDSIDEKELLEKNSKEIEADEDDEDEDEEGSSKLSNIIAGVFVVGLIAFNVYAFWGYKDYGMPEVTPPVPMDKAQISGDIATSSNSANGNVGIKGVPGVDNAKDSLGASGLSENKPSEPFPKMPPTSTDVKSEQSAPTATPTSVALNTSANTATTLPAGKTPSAVPAVPSATSSPSGEKKSTSSVAPPPGKRPEPIFATPISSSVNVEKNKDNLVAPPPGKRPEPIFSKYNQPGAGVSSVAASMLPGPQFLIGVSELCKEPSLMLNDEQKTKFNELLKLLSQDQKALTVAATQSLSYLSAEQVKWIALNRGPANIGDIESEPGLDPSTTAYMRLLRSKKEDGSKLTVGKYDNMGLTFQDVVNGVLKLESENPKLAINSAQAKELTTVLVAANQSRQSEAIHFQQLKEVLTAKQMEWLTEHPEKTNLDINDIILQYVQQVCK